MEANANAGWMVNKIAVTRIDNKKSQHARNNTGQHGNTGDAKYHRQLKIRILQLLPFQQSCEDQMRMMDVQQQPLLAHQ